MHARLIIKSLKAAEVDWFRMSNEEGVGLETGKTMFLWLGACDSNEEYVGYELPSAMLDETVSLDDGDQNLRDILQSCFQWGGFPFYRSYRDGKHPLKGIVGTPDYRWILPRLTKDLLEI